MRRLIRNRLAWLCVKRAEILCYTAKFYTRNFPAESIGFKTGEFYLALSELWYELAKGIYPEAKEKL